VPEDGTEEIAASLNPFSLEPFDDNAPNGLFELPLSLFLDTINSFDSFLLLKYFAYPHFLPSTRILYFDRGV
jgi:hypothetical protein